jgi:hypothetical protein
LSAWLFVKVKPWGNGSESVERWYLRSLVEQSYEILKLKTRLIETIRNALSSPFDTNLIDALAILNMCICMTEGYDATKIHRDAFVCLVAR